MPRTMPTLLIALALSFASATAFAQGVIRVYVTSSDEGSGFTSKGTDDSVLDLTHALNGKRRLMLVGSAAEADLVVKVESRDSHREPGNVVTYRDRRGRTQAFSTIRNERVVYATIEVDEYRHQLHGEGATWRAASDRVASQVDKWVEQNLVRLVERRQGGGR